MNVSFYVYEHVFPNNKRYIGITSQTPEERWDWGWGYRESIQPLMSRAIKKYGWKNIQHNILYSGLSIEEAKNKEKELILKYHTCVLDPQCQGYNMTYGGEGALKYLTEDEKNQALKNSFKKWRESHREQHNQAQQEYYKKNRDIILLKQRKKRAEERKDKPIHIPQTREEQLAKKRECERKRKENMTPEEKEELKRKKREYYQKNKEKILQKHKDKYHNMTPEQKEQHNKKALEYRLAHKEEAHQYSHMRWLEEKKNRKEKKR